MQWLL